jgi:HAD superfamily phosphoserine phosphatase-like hydrolase
MTDAPLDAARLHLFLDFDGTITRTDTLEFLVQRFGAGVEGYRETNRLIHEEGLSLRDAIARDMGTLTVPLHEAAPHLQAEVALDPGFAPLVRWGAAHGVPVTVLSGGFHELIDLFIDGGEFPDLEIRANRFAPGTWRAVFRDGSPHGHDKSVAVRAARTAGLHTVFVGDGVSDLEPAGVADEVFARAGRSLVDLCRRRGIACRPFETLAEVHASLDGRLRRSAAS